tara:strand:- start:17545 stop:18024 length:480 start_codon:yes stop_codon:yes gene_type:complete
MTYITHSILKNPKAITTVNTSMQETGDSKNTFLTINGSVITYTPSSDASKVIYEISFFAKRYYDYTLNVVQLEEYDGSTWSEVNAKFKRNFGCGGTTDQTHRWYLHFRFILPSWSGEKQLRLRISPTHDNRTIELHKEEHFAGGLSTFYINTNLLVYSI